MKPLIPKIIRMLNDTAKYPSMYAYDVEVMLMRVTTLLEVSEAPFSVSEFYCKYGGKNGNRYLFELPEGVLFDDWARQMIGDAIKMIEANPLMENKNEAPKTI